MVGFRYNIGADWETYVIIFTTGRFRRF
ncbi:MAG: hypothetical protein ACLSHB_16990 [Bacteroides thetaiotaomicron]